MEYCMNTPFAIDFQWLVMNDGNRFQQAAFSEMIIRVGGNFATELEDTSAKTVRKGARLSAYDLAMWLSSNWWRLTNEPKRSTLSWEMSHKLSAIGNGYLWPDLTFIGDGHGIRVESRDSLYDQSQLVRYLNNFDSIISVPDFEKGVGAFIESVKSRLISQELNDAELIPLWQKVCDERNDHNLSHQRKLEALMGYDPEEAPDELMGEITNAEKEFGSDAIEELAAYSMDKTNRLLVTLWEETRHYAVPLKVPKTVNLREKIQSFISSSVEPWKIAEKAAKITREMWDTPDGPITTDVLCEFLSAPKKFIKEQDARQSPIAAGFRSKEDENSISVFLNNPRPANRRFALARLIGSHIMTGEIEKLLPSTTVYTWRQKFQRAFAQEFLCPYRDLEEFFKNEEASDDGVDNAAHYFDVSPLTIRTILVNKGRLDRSNLTCEFK